eukprot:671738-Prymnesium_polylepis.1
MPFAWPSTQARGTHAPVAPFWIEGHTSVLLGIAQHAEGFVHRWIGAMARVQQPRPEQLESPRRAGNSAAPWPSSVAARMAPTT